MGPLEVNTPHHPFVAFVARSIREDGDSLVIDDARARVIEDRLSRVTEPRRVAAELILLGRELSSQSKHAESCVQVISRLVVRLLGDDETLQRIVNR